ncbi:hypothetical protein [Mesorhizobium sp. KR1-2]|uniref:hypothetical protein n=1 Tax=Mesorhizobium sp. KR1-2 TaxID=3156609 RepID=UPI0032B50D2F
MIHSGATGGPIPKRSDIENRDETENRLANAGYETNLAAGRHNPGGTEAGKTRATHARMEAHPFGGRQLRLRNLA